MLAKPTTEKKLKPELFNGILQIPQEDAIANTMMGQEYEQEIQEGYPKDQQACEETLNTQINVN